MADATYFDSTTFDKLENQRAYRLRNGNACTKKYERTPKGKLVRTYRNMYSRVEGILQTKRHLYYGLPILDREEFYAWALEDDGFWRHFENWRAGGYRCGDSPSIDRIDPERGYVLGNMRWISHRENSRLTRRLKSAR